MKAKLFKIIKKRLSNSFRNENGTILVATVLFLLLFILVLGVALDLSNRARAKIAIEVASDLGASSGARMIDYDWLLQEKQIRLSEDPYSGAAKIADTTTRLNMALWSGSQSVKNFNTVIEVHNDTNWANPYYSPQQKALGQATLGLPRYPRPGVLVYSKADTTNYFITPGIFQTVEKLYGVSIPKLVPKPVECVSVAEIVERQVEPVH